MSVPGKLWCIFAALDLLDIFCFNAASHWLYILGTLSKRNLKCIIAQILRNSHFVFSIIHEVKTQISKRISCAHHTSTFNLTRGSLNYQTFITTVLLLSQSIANNMWLLHTICWQFTNTILNIPNIKIQ